VAPEQPVAAVVPVSHEEVIPDRPDEKQPEKPPEKRTPLGDRLQLPADLPGRDAPMITLPELKPGNEAARKAAIDRYFPALPPLPDLPQPPPGPDGRPVTLADLQQQALASSPLIRQADAAVEAARGVAIQAGLYPNPRVGYDGDSINQANTAGSQGGFVEQTVKTAKKLRVARAAAEVDVAIAELAMRRAVVDLKTAVRRGYFSVLVAQRSLRVARAFSSLTTEVYAIQVTRLRLGQAAAYEPLQARVLALQARAALLQAQNRYTSAWKQLGATLSQPNLHPLALAGDLDRAAPSYHSDDVLGWVLANHTDVLTAQDTISRAQLNLRQAEIVPIPDVDLHYEVQYDKTARPNNAMHNVSVGVQLPLWNRNQGGIREAAANLSRAADEPQRVRNDLATQVAAAFERYNNNLALVQMYRDQIVPDQVRAYRNIYRRYDTEPEALNFNDVITAQQTLADTIRNYVDSLGTLWDSVVDIAALLQKDELFDGDGQPGVLDRCVLPELEWLPTPRRQAPPMPPADPLPKPRTVPQGKLPGPAHAEPVEQVAALATDESSVARRVSFQVRQLVDAEALAGKMTTCEKE
jgi:cobalt-zinc-cadmium efflux system outer membrane protein